MLMLTKCNKAIRWTSCMAGSKYQNNEFVTKTPLIKNFLLSSKCQLVKE